MILDLRQMARALGGDVAGHNSINCPAPGHSAQDRSLSVRLDPTAPNGFIVHSFAADDWRGCRDHVRERLDLRRETAPRRTLKNTVAEVALVGLGGILREQGRR